MNTRRLSFLVLASVLVLVIGVTPPALSGNTPPAPSRSIAELPAPKPASAQGNTTSTWEGTLIPCYTDDCQFPNEAQVTTTSVRQATLSPTTQAGEGVSFEVTEDEFGQPVLVHFQAQATAAFWPDESRYTCFVGSSLHSVDFSTDNFLPFEGGYVFGDAGVVDADYYGYQVSGQINPGGLFPTEARGAMYITYYYHDPDGATRIDGCTWLWTANCVENCESPGEFAFSQASYEVDEAAGEIIITVNRNVGSVGEASVDYATSNGTATAGADYTAASGTLTFDDGVTQQTFTVSIIEDTEIEGLETVNLTLSNPTNDATLGAQSTAELVIDDRPDLSIDAFTLNPADTNQNGSQYILPVKVTVRNNADSGAPVSNVAVKFTDNGDWTHTEIIAQLAAGGSDTFTVDWDITSLLVAGNGVADISLTGAIDPNDAVPETSEANNSHTASSSVDVRPQILSVKPKYTLDGYYFLDNTDLANEVKVTVDWNGELPGTGSAPYGQVLFDLNGDETSVVGQSWGAAHTYDMGDDFESSLACANNTLHIQATTDFGSLLETIQPTVFPFPGWVEWVIQNIPGSDSTFETKPKAPIVEYLYDFKYPDPPFEAIWTVPDPVPYLGGGDIGIQETQASANAAGKSSGSGTVGVSGQTGLVVAAFNVGGEVWGEGDVIFVCGESLALERAELGFSIHSTIAREMGLVELFPALAAAESWPLVGGAIEWINDTAVVEASMTPEIQIQTEFEAVNDELEFVAGEGTGSIATSAALSIEPIDGLLARVSGGGTPYVTIQVPANPDYLKEVGIDLFFEALLQAWQFEASYRRDVNCNYPGGCGVTSARNQSVAAASPEPTWQLIPRDYAGADYAVFNNLASGASPGISIAITNTETILAANIYPRPEPTLAVHSDGQRVLVYVHDDTSKPQGRGTEIRALIWNGSSWNTPTDLTDDQQPDFAPAVTFDGNGNGVLVWERSTLPGGITPTLDITFAQSLEVFARTGNGTAFDNEMSLSSNSLMDHAPRLSTGNDGAVMALWQTSDGTDILGTAGHPLTYTYAVWDGNAWSAPAPALTGLQSVIKSSFAVYSATQAALVYVQDTSGILDNTRMELYYSTYDGINWSAPARLTNDSLPDIAPALAYDTAGDLHLAWLRDGNLVWLKNSWDVNQAQTVRSASTGGGFLNFSLNRDLTGNVALVWQAAAAEGANLAYAIYDASANAWSKDRVLMTGAAVEADHSPAFGNDGALYLAYQKIDMDLLTQTITLSPTLSYTVTNMPSPGQSDLAFFSHTVGRDLTFDSLVVSPTNPAPGQPITLTAILRNAGDLTVVAPQVAFFDGLTAIVTQTLSELDAGYTRTVQLNNWTLPVDTSSHTLRAVADPNGLATETDESNNEITLDTTQPDLLIDLLYTTHDSNVLTVTTHIVNAGVLDVSMPFSVSLRAGHPLTGTHLGTAAIPGLEAGGRYTLTQAVGAATLLTASGETLWAVADEGNSVAEIDESNNTATIALNILPDLTLTARDIAGGEVLLAVTIHNRGFITATDVLVLVGQGDQAPITPTLAYSETLSSIAPGEMGIVTILSSPGDYTFFAKADPFNTIAELNESNNLAVRTVTIKRKRIYLPLIRKQ